MKIVNYIKSLLLIAVAAAPHSGWSEDNDPNLPPCTVASNKVYTLREVPKSSEEVDETDEDDCPDGGPVRSYIPIMQNYGDKIKQRRIYYVEGRSGGCPPEITSENEYDVPVGPRYRGPRRWNENCPDDDGPDDDDDGPDGDCDGDGMLNSVDPTPGCGGGGGGETNDCLRTYPTDAPSAACYGAVAPIVLDVLPAAVPDPDELNIIYDRIDVRRYRPGNPTYDGSVNPGGVLTYLKETYSRQKLSGCIDDGLSVNGQYSYVINPVNLEQCRTEISGLNRRFRSYYLRDTDPGDQIPDTALVRNRVSTYRRGSETVKIKDSWTLSSPYTTGQYISDVRATDPGWHTTFPYQSVADEYFYIGSHNLSEDEESYSYRKTRFKFEWGSNVAEEDKHPVTYFYLFTPYDDPETEDVDESLNVEIVGNPVTWDGAGSSETFTFDPSTELPDKYGYVTLLKMDLAGHTQGPSGTRVSEADEDDPNNLLLATNYDFEEELRDNEGRAESDLSNDVFDPVKDHDYMKIVLKAPSGLSQGTLSLKSRFGSNTTDLPANVFVSFYSEDGSTKLGSSDFTLDLSNPQGALAGLASTGEVTLLAEGTDSSGREDAILIFTYENGSVSVSDEIHFHLIDVYFEEESPNSGFDDNDDQIGDIANPALMIPLPPGGSGNNKVRVTVKPSSLFDKVKLVVDNANIASASPLTLSSGDTEITVSGTIHGTTELSAQFKDSNDNEIGEAARIYIDVKNRQPNNAGSFKTVTAYAVKDLNGSTPIGKSASTIEDYLNNETWGKQANVYCDIIDSGSRVVHYDTNGTPGLRKGNAGSTEVLAIRNGIPEANAEINIFYVIDIEGTGVNGFEAGIVGGASFIFIEDAKDIDTTAHEYGHGLGLNGVDGQGHSETSTDVMAPKLQGSPLRKQIRRYDWDQVNP